VNRVTPVWYAPPLYTMCKLMSLLETGAESGRSCGLVKVYFFSVWIQLLEAGMGSTSE
jgi:hypothetical protein